MTNLIVWLSSCAMCDEFIYVILLRKHDGNIKIWWGNKVICTEKSLKFLSSVFGVELSPTKICAKKSTKCILITGHIITLPIQFAPPPFPLQAPKYIDIYST